MNEMQTVTIDMIQSIEEVLEDLKKCEHNKSAARRVRKFTTSMGNGIGKDFRKISIAHEKK